MKRFICLRGDTAAAMLDDPAVSSFTNTSPARVGLPAFRSGPADGFVFGLTSSTGRDALHSFWSIDAGRFLESPVEAGPSSTSIGELHDVVAAPLGGWEVWTGTTATVAGERQRVQFLAGSENGENPRVFAWAGQDAAGCAPGERWKAFTSIACPGLDTRAVFVASLAGRGVTAKWDQGVWCVGADGTPRLLLREGEEVSGKVVSSFKVLPGNALSRGSSRGGNSIGQVAVLLTFRDRSSAIAILEAW